MAGGVAVGPATRAFREAGPYGMSGPGYATGTATRAAREGRGAGPPRPAGPWTPPPVPAGYFNPIRDIELSEGKRGSEQALSSDSRQRTNAENDYATSVTVQGEKEAEQKKSAEEQAANLVRSYQRLGARQGEQANASGELYGGALLASAGKRAENEGVERAAQETARGNQLAQDENERGRASVAEGQLLGPGGSLTESEANTRINQQAFNEGIGTLKDNEAAANGYNAPAASPFNKVNPLSGEHFRVFKDAKGRTVHEYHSGRKVRA